MKLKNNQSSKSLFKKNKKKQPLNKKRLNNKVLKAKEVLAKNREAMKNAGKLPDAPQIPAWKRTFRIVRRVLLWVMVAFLAVVLISFLVIRIQGGTPTVFGYSIQRITTGSMRPALEVGDMIISKTVSSPDQIHVGDIVTFQGGSAVDYRSITHRVVEEPSLNDEGEYVLTTKGDANTEPERDVKFSRVQFVYVSKFDFINKVYNFFLSPPGLLTFIAALILAFFDEILTIAKVLTGNYHEEDDEDEETRLIREQEEEEQRRAEELREKKLKNPRKYDSTSNKKKKNRKKQAKKAKKK